MIETLDSRLTVLQNPKFESLVFRDRVDFLAGCADQELIDYTSKVIEASKPILTKICAARNKSGCVLGVTRRVKDFPVYMVEIGKVATDDARYVPGSKIDRYYEFCNGKAKTLQDNPQFTRSSQNISDLPKESRAKSTVTNEAFPGGAIVVGDYIISISGVSSDPIDDENAALKIVAALR